MIYMGTPLKELEQQIRNPDLFALMTKMPPGVVELYERVKRNPPSIHRKPTLAVVNTAPMTPAKPARDPRCSVLQHAPGVSSFTAEDYK